MHPISSHFIIGGFSNVIVYNVNEHEEEHGDLRVELINVFIDV